MPGGTRGRFPRLISRRDAAAGETAYYHFDVLGSTLKQSDATEVVTDQYVYLAFGRRR
jgi:hypothetical protein